jgi:hypothetical protein
MRIRDTEKDLEMTVRKSPVQMRKKSDEKAVA